MAGSFDIPNVDAEDIRPEAIRQCTKPVGLLEGLFKMEPTDPQLKEALEEKATRELNACVEGKLDIWQADIRARDRLQEIILGAKGLYGEELKAYNRRYEKELEGMQAQHPEVADVMVMLNRGEGIFQVLAHHLALAAKP